MKNYKYEDILETQELIDFKVWQMKVNLDNIRQNYDYLLENAKSIINDSEYAIVRQLQVYCYFEDDINWNIIPNESVLEYLQDFINEYLEEEQTK